MMFFTEVIRMFSFTTQYNNEKAEKAEKKDTVKREFHPIPEGDYECLIFNAKFGETPRGAQYIAIELMIDPKYNEDYGKQHAFLQYWRRKATGEYDPLTLQAIAKAAGIPDGTQINSEEQFMSLIKHKHVLVHLQVEEEDYGGRHYIRNRAFWNDWKESEKYSNEPSFAEKQSQQSTDNATTTQDKSQTVIPDGAEMDSLMNDIGNSTKMAQEKKDKLQNNAQDQDEITIDDEDLPF